MSLGVTSESGGGLKKGKEKKRTFGTRNRCGTWALSENKKSGKKKRRKNKKEKKKRKHVGEGSEKTKTAAREWDGILRSK